MVARKTRALGKKVPIWFRPASVSQMQRLVSVGWWELSHPALTSTPTAKASYIRLRMPTCPSSTGVILCSSSRARGQFLRAKTPGWPSSVGDGEC